MSALALVGLEELMALSRGDVRIQIGLIDGRVIIDQDSVSADHIRELPTDIPSSQSGQHSIASRHATFIAGILLAKSDGEVRGICPNCTLLVRPIFGDTPAHVSGGLSCSTPQSLAQGIVDCVDAGARLINLSLGISHPSSVGERIVNQALNYAASRGVLTIAAAGNQASMGSSVITRHPAVIPVVACDLNSRLTLSSNLGSLIGRNGLTAPGTGIRSLGPSGQSFEFEGTSIAAAVVTGTVALLWSLFYSAGVDEIKQAVTQINGNRRTSVVPPLLDGNASLKVLTRRGRTR